MWYVTHVSYNLGGGHHQDIAPRQRGVQGVAGHGLPVLEAERPYQLLQLLPELLALLPPPVAPHHPLPSLPGVQPAPPGGGVRLLPGTSRLPALGGRWV